MKSLVVLIVIALLVSSSSASRRRGSDPAKDSTGAPTEDNPIIYNVPGSDAEEMKEVDDRNHSCADHLEECDPQSSFTEVTDTLQDVWEVPKESNCCKGLVCKAGQVDGAKGKCERY